MMFTKVKLAFGAALAFALTIGGVASDTGPAPATAQSPRVPSELDALRKENELLKVNLMVLLEKVRTQEAELAALRGSRKPSTAQSSSSAQPGPATNNFSPSGPTMTLGPDQNKLSRYESTYRRLMMGNSANSPDVLKPSNRGEAPPSKSGAKADAGALFRGLETLARQARDEGDIDRAIEALEEAAKLLRQQKQNQSRRR